MGIIGDITQKYPIAFYAKKKACKYQKGICRLERNRRSELLMKKRLIAVMSSNNKTVTRLVAPGR